MARLLHLHRAQFDVLPLPPGPDPKSQGFDPQRAGHHPVAEFVHEDARREHEKHEEDGHGLAAREKVGDALEVQANPVAQPRQQHNQQEDSDQAMQYIHERTNLRALEGEIRYDLNRWGVKNTAPKLCKTFEKPKPRPAALATRSDRGPPGRVRGGLVVVAHASRP